MLTKKETIIVARALGNACPKGTEADREAWAIMVNQVKDGGVSTKYVELFDALILKPWMPV